MGGEVLRSADTGRVNMWGRESRTVCRASPAHVLLSKNWSHEVRPRSLKAHRKLDLPEFYSTNGQKVFFSVKPRTGGTNAILANTI